MASEDSAQFVRECERALCATHRCDCEITGVLLTPDQMRYLYSAANSYDSRIPAEVHRPQWICELEEELGLIPAALRLTPSAESDTDG